MHRGIKGILLGTAIGLVGILIGFSTPGIEFERDVGLDWLFTARGEISPPSEVAVIAIGGFTGGLRLKRQLLAVERVQI